MSPDIAPTVERQLSGAGRSGGKWYVCKRTDGEWVYLSRWGAWLPYADDQQGNLVGYYDTKEEAIAALAAESEAPE